MERSSRCASLVIHFIVFIRTRLSSHHPGFSSFFFFFLSSPKHRRSVPLSKDQCVTTNGTPFVFLYILHFVDHYYKDYYSPRSLRAKEQATKIFIFSLFPPRILRNHSMYYHVSVWSSISIFIIISIIIISIPSPFKNVWICRVLTRTVFLFDPYCTYYI